MSYIKYRKLSEAEFKACSSETARYRHLTAPYCFGCGVDIASQGAAVVPWAISFDLPEDEFLFYSNGQAPKGPIHLRGHADHLPFESGSLDFVYSSHFLEDVFEWLPMLEEWTRCVRIGGRIIILVPDKELWGKAILAGQPPNCEHRHESRAGELTEIFTEYFGHFEINRDSLTNVHPGDYTVMFTATRLR
jgi:SAM-dependent methyltransferase